MSSKYDNNYFLFDDETQQIVAVKEDIPKALKEFMNGNIFDTTKYFYTFVEEIYNVINSGSLTLPKGLAKLSTTYSPCEVCKSNDNVLPEYVRCRHLPDCKDHQKKLKNPHHKETCDCRVFTSPCLTWTKIGVALHLQFNDNPKFNIDIDLSPPVIHVKNADRFDGSNDLKRQWIEKNRPYLWLPEWRKTPNMSAAKRGGKRSIRLRRINRNLVIPERVSSINKNFLNSDNDTDKIF